MMAFVPKQRVKQKRQALWTKLLLKLPGPPEHKDFVGGYDKGSISDFRPTRSRGSSGKGCGIQNSFIIYFLSPLPLRVASVPSPTLGGSTKCIHLGFYHLRRKITQKGRAPLLGSSQGLSWGRRVYLGAEDRRTPFKIHRVAALRGGG